MDALNYTEIVRDNVNPRGVLQNRAEKRAAEARTNYVHTSSRRRAIFFSFYRNACSPSHAILDRRLGNSVARLLRPLRVAETCFSDRNDAAEMR